MTWSWLKLPQCFQHDDEEESTCCTSSIDLPTHGVMIKVWKEHRAFLIKKKYFRSHIRGCCVFVTWNLMEEKDHVWDTELLLYKRRHRMMYLLNINKVFNGYYMTDEKNVSSSTLFLKIFLKQASEANPFSMSSSWHKMLWNRGGCC